MATAGRKRARYLNANPLCVRCERQGLVRTATVVDHSIPHRGDQALFWNESNWQSLCKRCHDSDKQIEEKSGEQWTNFDADSRVIRGPGA